MWNSCGDELSGPGSNWRSSQVPHPRRHSGFELRSTRGDWIPSWRTYRMDDDSFEPKQNTFSATPKFSRGFQPAVQNVVVSRTTSLSILVLISLACIGLLVTRQVSNIAPGEFQILDVNFGKGAIAVSGTVRLPRGVTLDNTDVALRVVDEKGQTFTALYLPRRQHEVKFQIPSGYPRTHGRANLQLVIKGQVKATADLGPLPTFHEEFAVFRHPDVQVLAKGQKLVIGANLSAGDSDEIWLKPSRTENQVFEPNKRIPMSRKASGGYQAEITLPYASSASKFEFEILRRVYKPDEFLFEGASLALKDGCVILTVPKEAYSTSKLGRRIRIPRQRQVGQPYRRRIPIDMEVVEGRPYTSMRKPHEVADPPPASMGLERLDVRLSWNPRLITPSRGGGGHIYPEERLPRSQVKTGPIGPLKVRLYLSDEPSTTIYQFAVPVVQP